MDFEKLMKERVNNLLERDRISYENIFLRSYLETKLVLCDLSVREIRQIYMTMRYNNNKLKMLSLKKRS